MCWEYYFKFRLKPKNTMSKDTKTKTKKRRHHRKKSNESLISIDPYSLSILRNDSKRHIRRNRTELNLKGIPKRYQTPNNNNNKFGYNPQKNAKLSSTAFKEDEDDDDKNLIKKKQMEEEVQISIEELEPMLKDVANQIQELTSESKEYKEEIRKLTEEKEQLLKDYENEVTQLQEELKFYEKQINDLTIGDNKNDFSSIAKQLKDSFQDEIDELKEKHSNDIKILINENNSLKVELEDMYTVENQLKKSLQISEHENDNLRKEMNDYHQNLQKLKLIKKEKQNLIKDNEQLRDIVENQQIELEQYIQLSNNVRNKFP